MAKFGYVTLSMTAASTTAGTAVDISHLRHICVQLVQSSSESATALSARIELSLDGTNYARVGSYECANSADLTGVSAFVTLSFPNAGTNYEGRFKTARLKCMGYGAGAVKAIVSGEDVTQP